MISKSVEHQYHRVLLVLSFAPKWHNCICWWKNDGAGQSRGQRRHASSLTTTNDVTQVSRLDVDIKTWSGIYNFHFTSFTGSEKTKNNKHTKKVGKKVLLGGVMGGLIDISNVLFFYIQLEFIDDRVQMNAFFRRKGLVFYLNRRKVSFIATIRHVIRFLFCWSK